jgi:hypothetical protein
MSTAEKPKAGLEDRRDILSICYLDGDRGVLRTAGTTSTTWRETRRSKKSVICCGTAACRRAPNSAICNRS